MKKNLWGGRTPESLHKSFTATSVVNPRTMIGVAHDGTILLAETDGTHDWHVDARKPWL
jgi:exopolysaccharide biosynthesis protein